MSHREHQHIRISAIVSSFCGGVLVLSSLSECGVTANMLVLGTSDSGFESRHSDSLSISRCNDYMSSEVFKKRVEDFVCEHCGVKNAGNGYTNHCTACLWSKHVDNNPGDREASCNGMMKPVGVEGIVGKYDLVFKCELCGEIKRNKVWPEDNFEEVLRVARQKKVD